MGQRAYRGKYTDSLVRDYINKKENILEDQYFFSGKPKDVKFQFDLDDPLKDIDITAINLNRGLLNCLVPKNTKINNLDLQIKSKILGEKITYLHSNLFCLFGTHFIKDISYININLFNPDTLKFVNDRRLIKNILDFMCFKTIKLVNINKNLMYYVIPENSEFAIVLAYKEINYKENHKNFLRNLQDLIFHPYSKFSDTEENFRKCLAAIDKTIPKDVTNIILPTILINFGSLDEVEKRKEKVIGFSDCFDESFLAFKNLKNFLVEIKNRDYRVISLELNISIEKFCKKNENFEDFFLENNKKKEDLKEFYINSEKKEHEHKNKFPVDKISKIKYPCCCDSKNKKNISETAENIQAYSEQYIKLTKIFFEENLEILKSFQQVFITFDYNFLNNYNLENSCTENNEFIAYNFKKLILKFDLENVTLIHHISFNRINEQTLLEDQYNYLDYVFYNKDLAEELYKKLFLFKNSEVLNKLYKKKGIIHKILSEYMFDFKNELFKTGRKDFSVQMMRNSKIVPMQINSNSTMVFYNN